MPTLAEAEDLAAGRARRTSSSRTSPCGTAPGRCSGRAARSIRPQWPVVELERRVETGDLYAVRWDEETLSEELSARPLDPSEAGLRPRDVLSGAGAAVVRLRHALGL